MVLVSVLCSLSVTETVGFSVVPPILPPKRLSIEQSSSWPGPDCAVACPPGSVIVRNSVSVTSDAIRTGSNSDLLKSFILVM